MSGDDKSAELGRRAQALLEEIDQREQAFVDQLPETLAKIDAAAETVDPAYRHAVDGIRDATAALGATYAARRTRRPWWRRLLRLS